MQGVRVLSAAACALTLSTLCAASARADVVPVASASATGTTATVTTSVAVPAGTGRLLAVGVSTTDAAPVTGVSYGGQALTKRVSQAQAGTSVSGVAAEIWTLSDPDVGSATVTVTLADAGPSVVGATAFSGVDALSPVIVATATPGEDASNSASIALNDTTAGDGMFGVLALGNVTNTSGPFTQGSTDLVVADLRWASQAGAVRGAGATRSGNTGQNQATTAGIQWRWTNEQSALNPHVNAVLALRKAADAVAPTVTTADATAVGETSATLNGQVTSTGNGILTAHGVAYCESPCTPEVGAPGTEYREDGGGSTEPFALTVNGLASGKAYTFRAYAVNGAGTGYGEPKSFTTTQANRAPVAVAIAAPALRYRITEGDGLELDASQSSDPDGDTLTYAWDLDGDGEYDDASGSTPKLTLTPLEVDALGFGDGPASTVLALRVSDGKLTAEATAPLTVENGAPTATPSGDTAVAEGATATIGLDGATDPGANDRPGLRYFFDTDGDGVANGSGETHQDALNDNSVSYTPDDDGTLHLTAAVIDKDGGVTRYPRDVTVTNVAPTATFGDDGPVAEGADAHVSFTAPSDPSNADTGAGFHYAYDLDGDGTWDVGDGTYAGGVSETTATVPAADDGPLDVRGAIVDKDGGVTTYTRTILVDNVAPSLTAATPDAAREGEPLTLTLDATDPSGADAAADFTYIITWGDGTPAQTVTGPAHATATHAYGTPGAYVVSVTATDKDGGASGAATTTATVTAKPAPPSPDTPTPDPTTPTPTQTTTQPAPAPVAGAGTTTPTRVTVSGLAVAPRCLRASTTATRQIKLKYQLSGAATVRVTLERATASKGARTCPPPRGIQQEDGTYKPGNYTPVSTRQTTGTSLTIAAGAKAAALGTAAAGGPRALLAKGAKLKAGTYLITVTPLGADGKPNGTAARVKFWVLKG